MCMYKAQYNTIQRIIPKAKIKKKNMSKDENIINHGTDTCIL